MEIKRELYLNQLISRKGNGFIKVVMGIRRCGKSYLLNNIFYNYLLESGVEKDHILITNIYCIKSRKKTDRQILKSSLTLVDLGVIISSPINVKSLLQSIRQSIEVARY